MRLHTAFEVQGHRGARGLRPENTLCGFEFALDLGVASIETDVHLTRDGVPVLCHDPIIRSAASQQFISHLTLTQLRLCPPVENAPGFPEQRADSGRPPRHFWAMPFRHRHKRNYLLF